MKRTILALAVTALLACSKEAVCPRDQAACGGTCTAVLTDIHNCGACGFACAAGEACGAGHCLCADGRADCSGSCVDLGSDPANCGACGQACGADQVCTTSGGFTACAASCADGRNACDRACVDLQSDRSHCGACDRACGSNESCVAQECLADLYLACSDTDQIAEATLGLTAAGTPTTVGRLPVALAWLDGRLYSANAVGGSISELRFDLPAPTPVAVSRTFAVDATSAYPDLEFVAAGNGLLYVSNASLGNLDVIDVATGVVIAAAHLDPAGSDAFTGPAGIAVVNGKAYVALNGADAIGVVDVSLCQASPPACSAGDCGDHPGTACVNGLCVPTGCPGTVTRITLPASLASTATGPSPYRLLQQGTRLYVTLQNLDRANGYLPAGEGRLAMVDLATDTLVQDAAGPLAVSLGTARKNPGELAAIGDTLYVACGYYDYFGSKGKQGMAIVPVSLATGATVVQSAVTQDLPVLGPIESCGGVIYAGATDSGAVVRYDPATSQLSSVALCPADPNGKSYVADLACRP